MQKIYSARSHLGDIEMVSLLVTQNSGSRVDRPQLNEQQNQRNLLTETKIRPHQDHLGNSQTPTPLTPSPRAMASCARQGAQGGTGGKGSSLSTAQELHRLGASSERVLEGKKRKR
ncbi:hypothetical protein LIA77_00967 [Sarocladium implicatum]|nr:hypothetical protein LIA77_00967 [Sarocladium implicatum]